MGSTSSTQSCSKSSFKNIRLFKRPRYFLDIISGKKYAVPRGLDFRNKVLVTEFIKNILEKPDPQYIAYIDIHGLSYFGYYYKFEIIGNLAKIFEEHKIIKDHIEEILYEHPDYVASIFDIKNIYTLYIIVEDNKEILMQYIKAYYPNMQSNG